MFDLLNRFILSPESLREKRRISQTSMVETSLEEFLTVHTNSLQEKHLIEDNDVDAFVETLLRKDCNVPRIVGIRKRNEESKGTSSTELMMKDSDSQLLILDLNHFCKKLSSAFEQQLTSTALCFVADASSGLGSEMIGQIVSACGMAIVKEPAWMLFLAKFVQDDYVSSQDVDMAVFALCRLEAWRLREQVGDHRTLVITIPGQSSTHNILPSLQKMFPCERHVFIYDGLLDSVSRGLRLIKDSNAAESFSISRHCSAVVPVTKLTSLTNFDVLLSKLSFDKASIVESWISSVDIFLKLKHAEKKTGYIPFVCRLGFLLSQVGKLGNGSVEQSDLALTNLLQYMTGSRSRALKKEFLETAQSEMKNVRAREVAMMEKGKQFGQEDIETIEACAFAHKGILIENKTLMDTVQPKLEWSLKAAKKLTSCACCMPGEEDDEEKETEEERKAADDDLNRKSIQKPISGYVDGKTMFAFDPSKFTGI